MYQLSVVTKIMFCIFILPYFKSIGSDKRVSYYDTAPLFLSISLTLPYPSLLRNSRLKRSRRLQHTTGVSARKVVATTMSVEKRWWEMHAVGPNSVRAACSRRSKRRATRLSGRVRLRNPKRKQSARWKSPDTVLIFFFFLKFYSQPWVVRLILSQL